MNLEVLSRLDLNLLVCLHTLYIEMNVTRAAQKMHLSQSAVSKSLAKLRLQFDDPLFIRTANGLRPTPKAIALKPKLDLLLSQLASICEPDTFNAETSSKQFTIALVESAYPLILPHFLPKLLSIAPHLTISSYTWNDETISQIRNGEIDVGITGKDIDPIILSKESDIPSNISMKEIYRDRQMCVVRKDHPVLSSEWNLERYLGLRHIQVRCDGNDQWLLDYKLREQGFRRDIAVTVPDFNSASALASYTDFVFTGPTHFLSLVATHYELGLLPLPFEISPMAYTLFWNSDRENDASLKWLVDLICINTNHLR